jgi:hypothetical protein
MHLHRLASVLALAFIVSTCGGVGGPSENRMEPFSGTFDVGGQGPTHLFSASKNGEFFVTLRELSPDATAYVGMLVGQQIDGGCQQIFGYYGRYSNDFTQVNVTGALSGPLDKGNYCLIVYDSGYSRLSGPQTYTVRVSYP